MLPGRSRGSSRRKQCFERDRRSSKLKKMLCRGRRSSALMKKLGKGQGDHQVVDEQITSSSLLIGLVRLGRG